MAPATHPPFLDSPRALADCIVAQSSAGVDRELIEEYFHDCGAVLRWVPLAELSEGNADGNQPDRKKQAAYDALPLATMPPLVIEGGVVEDGNHRLRAARAIGADGLWCYDVLPLEQLRQQPANGKRGPR